jgi:DNA polymerase-3 subunit gamma/tau
VVDASGLSGLTRQFALNCVPTGFENAMLRLQVDAAVAERRSKNISDKLEQCLSAYLGTDIRVAYERVESPLLTPARRQTMAEQDRMQRAATAFEEDPTVKGLRERFGAEVDAGSIKPLS